MCPGRFQEANGFGYRRNDEGSVIRLAKPGHLDQMPPRQEGSESDIASAASQAIELRAVPPTLNISARRQGATIRLIEISNECKAAKKYLILNASKVVRGPPNQ